MHPKHDEDFYGWAKHTADSLRIRDIAALDFGSLIEEIEDLGASKERELINRLSNLIAHLLKWNFQPSHRPWDISGKSWTLTIKEQRSQIKWLLKDNPSLKGRLESCLLKGFEYGILRAARETSLEELGFPKVCPYTFEQIMDDKFYPE